jgi:hypothetical protein
MMRAVTEVIEAAAAAAAVAAAAAAAAAAAESPHLNLNSVTRQPPV